MSGRLHLVPCGTYPDEIPLARTDGKCAARTRIIVLDLETSELSVTTACITEIAARCVKTQRYYTSLVECLRAIEPKASEITGITNAMVAPGAPGVRTLGEAWSELVALLIPDDDMPVRFVGHNMYGYDFIILIRGLGASAWRPNWYIGDTLFMARHLAVRPDVKDPRFARIGSFALKTLYHRLCKTPDRSIVPHRALGDVDMTMAVLMELGDMDEFMCLPFPRELTWEEAYQRGIFLGITTKNVQMNCRLFPGRPLDDIHYTTVMPDEDLGGAMVLVVKGQSQ